MKNRISWLIVYRYFLDVKGYDFRLDFGERRERGKRGQWLILYCLVFLKVLQLVVLKVCRVIKMFGSFGLIVIE